MEKHRLVSSDNRLGMNRINRILGILLYWVREKMEKHRLVSSDNRLGMNRINRILRDFIILGTRKDGKT
ncbi:MAG: hypothetical protein PHY48_06955 [Candidatus Cloacimonetes bacterium]|nr:hypothetical protein [Candidatus Cloacimonadota bacterium]